MTRKIFSLERTSKKQKLDVSRASKQGLWFSVYKTDFSKCSDFYMSNQEAIEFLRALNRDLNVYEGQGV